MCCSNPSRGRGRGRGRGTFNNNPTDEFQGSNPVDGGLELQIRGWDGADNRNDVIAFLLRKFGVQVQNYRFQGPLLYCSAPNPNAFQTLLDGNGVRFAGKALQIQRSRPMFSATSQGLGTGGFSSQQTKSIYEVLKSFLSTRYNAETGLLDLSNLTGDETLRQAGFFSSAVTQTKVRKL